MAFKNASARFGSYHTRIQQLSAKNQSLEMLQLGRETRVLQFSKKSTKLNKYERNEESFLISTISREKVQNSRLCGSGKIGANFENRTNGFINSIYHFFENYWARKWYYPKLYSLIKKSSKRHGFNLRESFWVSNVYELLNLQFVPGHLICRYYEGTIALTPRGGIITLEHDFYQWPPPSMSREHLHPPYVLVLLISYRSSSSSLLWLQFSMHS